MGCGIPISHPPSFNDFVEYLAGVPSLSESSRKRYVNIVKKFNKYMGPLDMVSAGKYLTLHPTQMTKSALVHYAKYNKNFNLALEIRETKVKFRPRKPHAIPTLDEFMKVIKWLPKEEKFIAWFLLYSGIRSREAFTILLKDIKPDGQVKVHDLKGDKWRTVIMPAEYNQRLIHYLRDRKGVLLEEPIFYSHLKTGLRAKRERFYKKLHEKSLRILGKSIGTHDFRRYCATFLYKRSGYDIDFVKRMLGHKSITTTQIYTQYVDREHDVSRAKKLLDELETQQNKIETG